MKRPLITISLAVMALAAGCGGSGGDPEADPAALAPARTPVYLEASLDPDDDFDAVAKKLAGTDDPGGELQRLFERSVNEDGGDFKWSKDIEPWIGERVGVFITDLKSEDFQGAFVAATKDPDKAKETLEDELARKDSDGPAPKVASRTYKEVDYKVDTANDSAVLVSGDVAVFGSEQGVKGAIDAEKGEALSEADSFKTARDQVDDDAVGFGYVKLSTIAGQLGPQGAALQQVLGDTGDTIAFSVDAEDDAIDVETAMLGVKEGAGGDPGSLLAEMPGDAWLAAGVADIGGQIEKGLQQIGRLGDTGGQDFEGILRQLEQQTGVDLRRDVLSWMGDGGLFVRGKSINDIGGALVVQSKDPGKSEAFVAKLRRLLGQIPDLTVRPLRGGNVDAGLVVRSSEFPFPVNIAVAGDRFIVAVTDGALEAAMSPSGKLGDSQAFKDAGKRLGDGVKPALFADTAPLRDLLNGLGVWEGGDKDVQQFKKVFDHLTTIAAGTSHEGDVQRGRLTVGVK